MKKTKIIIPALGLLLLSTAASVTGTVAWFSANTSVKATNMQVRAKAEKGLLINEVSTASDTNWDESATAAQTSSNPSLLYPASTANGTTWYHASSKKSGSAAGAAQGSASGDLSTSGYETLPTLTAITSMSATAAPGTNAARSTMGKTALDDAGYYVNYIYYLKSSAAEITLGTTAGDQNVQIKSVDATLPGTQNSENLNKSVRVGIKFNSEFYIYAPVAGYTSTYYVAASSTATTPKAGNVATLSDLATLPASNVAGAPVNVYIWFEGEDANCKTDNATAAVLDNIQIDITFELVTVPNA